MTAALTSLAGSITLLPTGIAGNSMAFEESRLRQMGNNTLLAQRNLKGAPPPKTAEVNFNYIVKILSLSYGFSVFLS